MKKVCEVCHEEFEASRVTAKYCSNACKMQSKKLSVSSEELSVSDFSVSSLSPMGNDTLTDTLTVSDKIKSMDYDTLRAHINSYAGNTWKDSPEFAELMHRLKTLSIAELEEAGFKGRIPNWKYNPKPIPKEL